MLEEQNTANVILSFWICFNSSCTTTSWWCETVLWFYSRWKELIQSRLDDVNTKMTFLRSVQASEQLGSETLLSWRSTVGQRLWLFCQKRAHCPKIHPDFWLLAWFVDREPRIFCTEDMDMDFELAGICFYLAGESFGTFISVIFAHVKWNPAPSASGSRFNVGCLGSTTLHDTRWLYAVISQRSPFPFVR